MSHHLSQVLHSNSSFFQDIDQFTNNQFQHTMQHTTYNQKCSLTGKWPTMWYYSKHIYWIMLSQSSQEYNGRHKSVFIWHLGTCCFRSCCKWLNRSCWHNQKVIYKVTSDKVPVLGQRNSSMHHHAAHHCIHQTAAGWQKEVNRANQDNAGAGDG